MEDTCNVEASAVENTFRKFGHIEIDWIIAIKAFIIKKINQNIKKFDVATF